MTQELMEKEKAPLPFFEEDSKLFIESIRSRNSIIYIKTDDLLKATTTVNQKLISLNYRRKLAVKDYQTFYFFWSSLGLHKCIEITFNPEDFKRCIWYDSFNSINSNIDMQKQSHAMEGYEDFSKALEPYEIISKLSMHKIEPIKEYGVFYVTTDFLAIKNNPKYIQSLLPISEQKNVFRYVIILSPHDFSEIPLELKNYTIKLDWTKHKSKNEIRNFLKTIITTEIDDDIIELFFNNAYSYSQIENIVCMTFVRNERKLSYEAVESVIKDGII